jgi:ABC-type antimicrobial peptide transport system permease subunit
MMKQRTKDFGLIKASGCPNSLVFGYFATELLLITFASNVLGIVLGLAADFAATTIFSLQVIQQSFDYWLVFLVFVAFIALTLIFGAKPLLDAAKLSPTKAFSSVYYFGLAAKN